MSNNNQKLTIRDVYEETGRNYRFALGWRRSIFGGYLVVLASLGVGFSWIHCEYPSLRWAVFLVAVLITSVFWIFELRNRAIYRACLDIGMKCEEKLDNGIYKRKKNLKTPFPFGLGKEQTAETKDVTEATKAKDITHSDVLDLFFLAMVILMFTGFVYFLNQPPPICA